MNYETSRRHPRTMSEAFSDTRASCTEGWQRTGDTAVAWTLAAGVIVVLLFIFVWG